MIHPLQFGRRMHICILVFVIIVLYAPSLGNDFVSFDDHFLVRDNVQVQSMDPSILWSYDPELYVPLTLLTYQFDHVLLGGSAAAVHLTSIVLHILTAIIVYLLLRRFAFEEFTAFFGALIFAVHPLQVESVAWASGRKELVYTLFFLLSILFFLRSETRKSQFAFLLSLFGKVTAITLPIVLLCIDWYEEKKFTTKTITSKWIYILMSVVFAVVAFFGKSSDVVLNLWETILLSFRTTFFFFTSFFVPANLTIIHPLTETIHSTNPEYYMPLLFVIGIVFGIFLIRDHMPRAALGFLLFFVTLAPSFLGYAKAGQIQLASEHYMYLPIFGLIIVLLSLVESAFDFLQKKMVYGLLGIWIIALIVVSFQRIQDWQTSESLYLRVLNVYPTSHMAASNVAAVYLEEDRVDDAIYMLEDALIWKPDYASAYVNLAEALRRKGDFAGAQKASMKALEIHPNIEDVYRKDDASDDVDADINAVLLEIENDPTHVDLWWRLGGLYGQKEMYIEGIEAFQHAASLDPSRKEQAEELQRLLEGM